MELSSSVHGNGATVFFGAVAGGVAVPTGFQSAKIQVNECALIPPAKGKQSAVTA